jgi:hypothetical protein
LGAGNLVFAVYVYVSEELAVLIRRGGLTIKKTHLRRGDAVVGEYIFVKRGLFEAEAEYDLEDRVLYYLQICWFGRCAVWFDGEPDRKPSPALVKRAIAFFRELSGFSYAAKAALRVLSSSISRSSPLSTSDLIHLDELGRRL